MFSLITSTLPFHLLRDTHLSGAKKGIPSLHSIHLKFGSIPIPGRKSKSRRPRGGEALLH